MKGRTCKLASLFCTSIIECFHFSLRDNEKYSIMTPFNVSHKILGPYLFSATTRETLSEKMELYFHDMSLVPLFIQV